MTNTSIQNNTNTNNQHKLRNKLIGATAIAVAWETQPYISKGIKQPMQKWVSASLKQIQGAEYNTYLEKAVSKYVKDKNFKFIDFNLENFDEILKIIKFTPKKNENKKTEKFANTISHILRLPTDKEHLKILKDIAKGNNAGFMPSENVILCNKNKFSAAGFHELAHKLNSESSNIFLKTLSKIRSPLAFLGSLFVSACAIFNNPKSKNDPNQKRTFFEKIKDNCGIIAVGVELPLVIEECIANIRGYKIAKNSGLPKDLLKKIKKVNLISTASYCSNLAVIYASVTLASKLKDVICEKMKK